MNLSIITMRYMKPLGRWKKLSALLPNEDRKKQLLFMLAGSYFQVGFFTTPCFLSSSTNEIPIMLTLSTCILYVLESCRYSCFWWQETECVLLNGRREVSYRNIFARQARGCEASCLLCPLGGGGLYPCHSPGVPNLRWLTFESYLW